METNFELAIQTKLIRNEESICQELTATAPNFRRWMVIYKYKEGPFYTPEEKSINWEYRILDFELDKINIEKEYDFFDDDVINRKWHYAKDLEELETILRSLQIDLSKFTYPWKCDCPL